MKNRHILYCLFIIFGLTTILFQPSKVYAACTGVLKCDHFIKDAFGNCISKADGWYTKSGCGYDAYGYCTGDDSCECHYNEGATCGEGTAPPPGYTCDESCDTTACAYGSGTGTCPAGQYCCNSAPPPSNNCTGVCEAVTTCPDGPATGDDCPPGQLCCYESPPVTGCLDPDNVVLTRISSSTWSLTWEQGGGGGYDHYIFIDKDKPKVGCNSPSCFAGNASEYKREIPPGATDPPNHGPIVISDLTPNWLYYIHILGYKKASDNCSSTTRALTSCDLTTLYVPVGETRPLTSVTSALAHSTNQGIHEVRFRFNSGGAYAEFSPHDSGDHHKWTDSGGPPYPRTFSANVSGLFPSGPDHAVVQDTVSLDGTNNDCQATANVFVGITPTPTPIQTGTIQARAMGVTEPNTSCTDINSGTGLTGTTFSFSPALPAQAAQSGSGYVTFPNAAAGPYTILPAPPSGYTPVRYCSGALDVGPNQTLAPAGTLTWDVGYTLGTPWSQAQGGDVYAGGVLQSYVPASKVFIVDGTTGGYPGVATYGTDYDFTSGAGKGADLVSSKKWLAGDMAPTTPDYYQLMYQQFGGAPAAVDYVNPDPAPMAITQPILPYKTAYYATGNMETSGNWTVTANNKLVLFVDGNLTINGSITVAPGGFAAFIVNGTITVDPAVAALAGIYITSSAGTFDTGSGDVRLAGTGMFVAGNFILRRNLGDAFNPTTSSELFTYDPSLWMLMPEAMKKLSVNWQEVAP